LFDRPDFKTMAGSTAGTGVELLNAYLMGSAGLDRWAAMPATDIQRRSLASAHADKSVFHVLRCGRGPDAHAGILCLGTEHNHAHHDKGQALIYGLGRHLITDPGVFYDQSDVDGVGQMRSSRIHAMACPIRRSPTGPRTDFGDLAVSLGRYQDQQLQVAMGQSLYYENHLVRRALALVTPWGPEAEAFWLVWDRVSWKRPWPAPCNEPLDMIDTSFPFNVPGGSAKIAADGRSVWSLYDGPDGKPFAPDAPPPNVICQAEERHDSDANIQVIRLGDDPAELWDVRISSGSSSQPGGKLWPRPVALFRWRGRMPHVVAYVLCPFRGVRDEPYASAVGQATPDGLQCRIILPAGIVTVKIDGLDAGPISGGVRV